MELKLFHVTYYDWNCTFSGLIPREILAVGMDGADAIARVKKKAPGDARDFHAEEITAVMGHEIKVVAQKKEKGAKNNVARRKH